jgi:hypothetical protein
MPTRLAIVSLDAAELVAAQPPRIANANKRLVYELACPPHAPHRGTLTVSRWCADALPRRASERCATALDVRPDLFTYAPGSTDALAWHANFADERLFVAYGSGLFAQDEMQVAEHPALASLREYLGSFPREAPLAAFTRGARVTPTPVLVRNVERRCAIATDRDVDQDRPFGLYGNQFARARPEAVRRAVRVLDPPTASNIVAIHAPPGGNGLYSLDDITDVLITAYTGFFAANEESREAGALRTVVHTGHWGTGAFGGNRVLMALLQMVAARLASLDSLVFHAVDEPGTDAWHEAYALLERSIWPLACSSGVPDALDAIHRLGFRWGVSDGN